tara:strand:- start:2236 stop:2511 length:276 start_codon:yes stop_codon:yes gene_type:complete
LIEKDSIILFISFNLTLLILLISEDFTRELINLKKAFSKPLFIKEFLSKLFLKGSEISISSIKNALALRFAVEKKNIFKDRIIKKIYKFLK